jgi:hypothetical protein
MAIKMNKAIWTILALSLLIGIIVSAYAKCIPTVDVVYSGCPLAWQSFVIPTHFYHMDYLNLIADIIIWFVVSVIVLGAAYFAAKNIFKIG